MFSGNKNKKQFKKWKNFLNYQKYFSNDLVRTSSKEIIYLKKNEEKKEKQEDYYSAIYKWVEHF